LPKKGKGISMTNKLLRSGFGLLVGLLFTCILALGQITGDLQINVSDQSSAAVPNAAVTVRNLDTGTTRNTATDSTGQIRVSQLDPGRYEVKVTAPGFSTTTQIAQVTSGGSSTLPFTLAVSSTSEQIVVESVATPINTVNPQLQGTVENAAIRDLPLVGTGILGLAATMPGITPVTPNNPFLGLGSYNSNGGRGRGNNIRSAGRDPGVQPDHQPVQCRIRPQCELAASGIDQSGH
jgi:hypothetical protein